MRKLYSLFVLATVFSITSCAPPYHYVAGEVFNNTILSLQSQMADQGYEYLGYETDYAKIVVRSRDKGQQATTYRFADSLGNTMEYTVAYTGKSDVRANHVSKIDFCGCKVSDPKDYERLCGIVEAVGQNLPQKNTRITVPKEEMEDAVGLVQSQLASQGFKMKGKSTMTHYDEKSNGWQTDTYHFHDSEGNTADVSIRYLKSYQDGVYGIELCGCETSNPKDVEKICGEEGVVKLIKELSKD